MTDCWYAFFPGDYLRDTAALSLMEHGAYRLLLDHYYSTGSPIPADKKLVYRICRASLAAERAAVDRVLKGFFRQELDGYHNPRTDAELVKRAGRAAERAESGRRGARNRWGRADAADGAATSQVVTQPCAKNGSAIPQEMAQPCLEESLDHPRNDGKRIASTTTTRATTKLESSNGSLGSADSLDDSKKIVLGKCTDDSQGTLSAALEVIVERIRRSGVNVSDPVKYLEAALHRFNFESGQDCEDWMQKRRRIPL
jgi:uncharacterized protein YdaU (DUF1376 family)